MDFIWRREAIGVPFMCFVLFYTFLVCCNIQITIETPWQTPINSDKAGKNQYLSTNTLRVRITAPLFDTSTFWSILWSDTTLLSIYHVSVTHLSCVCCVSVQGDDASSQSSDKWRFQIVWFSICTWSCFSTLSGIVMIWKLIVFQKIIF